MDDNTDIRKSKSQKKRDAEALKEFGGQLVALPLSKLDNLSLPDGLYLAIKQAKLIKSLGALRRQMQLIGKLMRAADSVLIIAKFDEIIAQDSAKTKAFHELEQWRTKLISDGQVAFGEFISCHPNVDTQQLRQLIKKAIKEHHDCCQNITSNGHKTGANRALFRFLRAC
jgi:ribosome-associated protein